MENYKKLKIVLLREVISQKNKILEQIKHGDISFNDLSEIDQNKKNQRIGAFLEYELMESKVIGPPYDFANKVRISKAFNMNGTYSNLLTTSTEGNKLKGEICMHSIQGQMNYTLYPGSGKPGGTFGIGTCGWVKKIIPINPIVKKVEVNIELLLPTDIDSVSYLIPGTIANNYCRNIGWYLASIRPLNAANEPIGNKYVSKMESFMDMDSEVRDEYKTRVTLKLEMELPPETVKLSHLVTGFIITETKEDSSPSPERNSQDFGLACIDLRSSDTGDRYPVVNDPLSPFPTAFNPGPGGIIVKMQINTYKIKL